MSKSAAPAMISHSRTRQKWNRASAGKSKVLHQRRFVRPPIRHHMRRSVDLPLFVRELLLHGHEPLTKRSTRCDRNVETVSRDSAPVSGAFSSPPGSD